MALDLESQHRQVVIVPQGIGKLVVTIGQPAELARPHRRQNLQLMPQIFNLFAPVVQTLGVARLSCRREIFSAATIAACQAIADDGPVVASHTPTFAALYDGSQ